MSADTTQQPIKEHTAQRVQPCLAIPRHATPRHINQTGCFCAVHTHTKPMLHTS